MLEEAKAREKYRLNKLQQSANPIRHWLHKLMKLSSASVSCTSCTKLGVAGKQLRH